ncbi:MAG: pyroglutamyl-peptidase I [Cephaloticoccus sp.]|nr:pyroglutamyl-peptidase I [Cephaloticoccus sp.]MCF7761407.1 pyroglutamyl-peptidase I [Cephaloticoccus sp.]
MKKILLTGFEPFGGARINPTESIARQLHGMVIGGHEVVGLVLPCVFGQSIRVLRRHIRAVQPVMVICLGQAGGRGAITPERVAINVDDARIADNAGAQPIDRPVVRGGPAAYFSTLPIKAMVSRLQAEGIAASVSASAGTFVCNHVFYGLMHALRDQAAIRGGFIHVPWLTKQGRPGLKLDTMIAGIVLVMEVATSRRRDIRIAGGHIH